MIFLMRHADAVSDEVDPARPLSARGRDQVAQVCASLSKAEAFRPEEVWHSPLARSRETAELLVKGLGLKAPLVLTAGLEPDDDPAGIAARLASEPRNIAVVGHEPHLGVLAYTLVSGVGRVSGAYFAFPKAAVVSIAREGKSWRLEWLARAP